MPMLPFPGLPISTHDPFFGHGTGQLSFSLAITMFRLCSPRKLGPLIIEEPGLATENGANGGEPRTDN